MNKLYFETGGQGEPIVLVHGWSMHSGVWEELAKQLSETFEVTCLDLPGHGKSQTIEPYNLEMLTHTIAENLPKKPCWLLGWSLGATVVLELACKFPQWVKGLVLLAFNPCFVAENQWPGMDNQTFEEFGRNMLQDSAYTLKRFDSLQTNGKKALLIQLKQLLARSNRPDDAVLAAGLNILHDTDSRLSIQQLDHRLTVILGTDDQIIPPATEFALRKLKADLEIRTLHGASHAAFLTHSRQICQIIKETCVS